ncbi:MAG: 5-bromo-4-chloroindolyl phosphate hydrolysis family protein [Clostridium sp.]|nr:5-bromo-4-chloroindolyl phosphate hydrolysis family protein [Clostridium sp.]
MRRNDFFDIEDKIRNAVDSAFGYIDNYENIKNSALNEVRNHLRRSTDFAQDTFDNISRMYKGSKAEKQENNNYNDLSNFGFHKKKAVSPYVAKRPAGFISSTLLSIFGTLGSIGSGLVAFAMIISIFASTSSYDVHISKIMAISFFIVFVFFLALTFIGNNSRKRIKRFKKYAAYIGDKSYCKIQSLASSIGEDNKFVVKDLQKMIKLDMFKEAYIDDENTYFMLGNHVYENYLNTRDAFYKRKEEEKKEKEEAKEDTSELGSVIRSGKEYIRQIREANDAIPGEIISAKLDKLEMIVTAIFNNIEKNKTNISDVKKFLNHYLPMTLKLVNSYKELDSQLVQGDNILKAKLEIEKSIDLINSAFEKLLDDLFADMVMDVSSDISVLETLFSQEGLTDDELKKKR